MKPLARHLAVTLALLSLVIAASPNASSASQQIVFLEVGDHHQEINAGKSVSYQWFIYNGYNDSYLMQVTTDLPSGPGWSSEFDKTVAVIAPGESLFVNLTVKASGDVDSRYANQTIYFTLTNLNLTTFILSEIGGAHSKMIPVWGSIAPGKNRLLGQFENPLPAPLDDNYVTFLLNIGIWAAIALFLAYVIGPAMRVFTKRTKTDLDDRLLKILHRPIFLLVIVFGVVSSFTILPLSENAVSSIYEAYGLVLIAILTFVVYKIYKEVIVYVGRKWASRTRTEVDDVLIPVFDKLGSIIILVFGAIALVNFLGYNITFLLAGVGVFGLVVAFAAQDALSNFFSGMALLLDRPFVEGDFVQLTSGEVCRIEKIGIRSCRLYDVFQNNHIVLPNNKLVNDKIVNLTEPDEQGIVEVVVNVVHGSDIKDVERTLLDIAKEHPDVLSEPGKEPAVRLSNFAESALEFKLFVWVDNFMKKWRVAHELRKEINKRFADENIEIAVPQRQVIIKERREE